jgi:hypothetical protein
MTELHAEQRAGADQDGRRDQGAGPTHLVDAEQVRDDLPEQETAGGELHGGQ